MHLQVKMQPKQANHQQQLQMQPKLMIGQLKLLRTQISLQKVVILPRA